MSFAGSRWLRFRNFFGQKFGKFPGYKSLPLLYVSIFHPVWDIHARPKKKTRGPGNFLCNFWAKIAKKPDFTTFLPLTRFIGDFQYRICEKWCLLSYCDHIDYLVAHFGHTFFARKISPKINFHNVRFGCWSRRGGQFVGKSPFENRKKNSSKIDSKHYQSLYYGFWTNLYAWNKS